MVFCSFLLDFFFLLEGAAGHLQQEAMKQRISRAATEWKNLLGFAVTGDAVLCSILVNIEENSKDEDRQSGVLGAEIYRTQHPNLHNILNIRTLF